MDQFVVTPATGHLLKAAGFPQDTHYRWYTTMAGESHLQRSRNQPWTDWMCAAPNAEELAAQLPTDLRIDRIWDNQGWSVFLGTGQWAEGPSLAEALGLLWLERRKHSW